MTVKIGHRQVGEVGDPTWRSWARLLAEAHTEGHGEGSPLDGGNLGRVWRTLPSFVSPVLVDAADDGVDEAVGVALAAGFQHQDDSIVQASDIYVQPARRRRRTGSRLVAEVLRHVGDDDSLVVASTFTEPGANFAARLGMAVALRQEHYRLDLASADLAALYRWDQPLAGYDLVAWDDECPEELLQSYCELKKVMEDAPRGDFEVAPRVGFSPETLRSAEASKKAVGIRNWTVVARHRWTGQLVGFHDLNMAGVGGAAWVGETGVVSAHRGQAIGLWLKSNLTLRLVRSDEPFTAITTSTACDNWPMKATNEQLGYRHTRKRSIWQARAGDLKHVVDGLVP